MQRKREWQKARYCVLALAILLPLSVSPAYAQVIFQREKLDISPPPPKEQNKPKPTEDPTQEVPRQTQHFMVEVRSEEALELEYIHTLNDLGQGGGVMIVFKLPSIVAVPTMKVYNPVDIVFINEDGTIAQIVPNITPAQINRDIEAKSPVLAFLYLKAGETKRRDIRPGDIVAHSAFNAKPVVIQ